MRFGKIRIEDGNFLFVRHMMLNSIPCTDVLWAYIKQEQSDNPESKKLLRTFLVITTRRKKIYQFDMPEKDAQNCLLLLKGLNPELVVDFPCGGRIPLQNLPNTRDLGALLTSDEEYIIPGRLLRSGDLYHMSQEDMQTLQENFRLRKIIDLRSERERRERPDSVIPDTEYHEIPLLDEDWGGIRGFDSVRRILRGVENYSWDQIAGMYQKVIEDPYCVRQLARILDVVVKEPMGPVLIHSSIGKDRTGMVIALILTILGVPRNTIRKDYMRSNDFLESDRKFMQNYLENRPGDHVDEIEKLEYVYGVREYSLNRMFQTIDRKFGSMDSFIQKQLLLSPTAIDKMRGYFIL